MFRGTAGQKRLLATETPMLTTCHSGLWDESCSGILDYMESFITLELFEEYILDVYQFFFFRYKTLF